MASSGLVGMSQRYYGQSPLVFMKHRDTDQYFLLDEGSSSSRGGVFGSVSYHELRDPEDSHIVSYEWKNRFQKNIPDLPDFEEWKKNADLMILSAENFENITVPFKVTVSLPDPDLVQERLNSLLE